MTTYTWTEHHMVVAPTEGALTNVVKKVIAVYTADDGNGKTYPQLMTVTLGAPDPENFTPYENLTVTQVIGCIEALLNMSYWQDYLDQRIAEQYLVQLPCPWD